MTKTNAKILLAAVFAARGSSFLFSKYLMEGLSAESILAVRFLISFVILAVVFRRKLRNCSIASLRGGIILGAAYSVCMFFEMHGLKTIDSGVSSFVENMAIVLVPVYVAVWTRKLPEKKTVICALLAIVGVWFLSISQMHGGLNIGIILTIAAAMTYAVCILLTERVSREGDPVTIGMIQLGVMGAVNLLAAVASGTAAIPGNGREWTMILMLAVVCSCFGFTFQPLAQKYLTAETAAVFSVVNPLTASILGVMIAGESMGVAKAAGYLLILGSLLLYNRGDRPSGVPRN